ncbi:MAG TPA: AcvB/VirJ family lysyl-phosphatidylglycerol hydrolase [Longimicrobium sp.]|nr:AcvB/VirJ family lysyl-phosphatidylglycerol hydrolase [Longimicrobium sp.]
MKLSSLPNPFRTLRGPAAQARLPRGLRHLPLVEERAAEPGRTFAFIFSGDGNWAMLVREMARELARAGVGCVGLKARTYLLARRRPRTVARHVERVLRHYLTAWDADQVVLVGLSRGADLLPFVARRLPDDLRQRVRLMALFSAATTTNFRFHWGDLFGFHPRPGDVPVIPELRAVRGIPVLCVNGSRDPSALGPALPPGIGEYVEMDDAGHNLGRDHLLAARLVLDRLRSPRLVQTAEGA